MKRRSLPQLRMVAPHQVDETQFDDYLSELLESGEQLTPYSLDRGNKSFTAYTTSLAKESLGIELPENWVPASTFFLIDHQGTIYGAINIRHRLTASLKQYGGHIGYGVRPGARRRGVGTLLLSLALDEARKLKLPKVLLTCARDNIPSARIIQHHGGVLESEGLVDDMLIQRYWITLLDKVVP